MTSELRPAVAVWQEAYGVWGDPSLPDTSEADQAASAVIEADREAVRAGVVGEIVAYLKKHKGFGAGWFGAEVEAKFG